MRSFSQLLFLLQQELYKEEWYKKQKSDLEVAWNEYTLRSSPLGSHSCPRSRERSGSFSSYNSLLKELNNKECIDITTKLLELSSDRNSNFLNSAVNYYLSIGVSEELIRSIIEKKAEI